jgi:dolichyl-phosphate beta-glucosyltransferase
VVSEFFHKDIDIKIVEYCHNRGKGGAIRLGGLLAKGKNILMADADGATKFDDYYRL